MLRARQVSPFDKSFRRLKASLAATSPVEDALPLQFSGRSLITGPCGQRRAQATQRFGLSPPKLVSVDAEASPNALKCLQHCPRLSY